MTSNKGVSKKEDKKGELKPGFVPMQRDLLYRLLFKSGPWAVTLYLWCCLRARYKDGEVEIGPGHVVSLKKGEVFIGCESVERELSCRGYRFTRQRYRTALAALKKTREITTKSTTLGTIVSVVRLEYPEPISFEPDEEANQDSNQQFEQEVTIDQTIEVTTIPTTNEKDTTDKPLGKNGVRRKLSKKRKETGVCPDGAGTHINLDPLSSLWKTATNSEITWTQDRERQVQRILRSYPEDTLVKAMTLHAD